MVGLIDVMTPAQLCDLDCHSNHPAILNKLCKTFSQYSRLEWMQSTLVEVLTKLKHTELKKCISDKSLSDEERVTQRSLYMQTLLGQFMATNRLRAKNSLFRSVCELQRFSKTRSNSLLRKRPFCD